MTEQRVAFITGASSGIGRATAIAFARANVHVVGTARRMERLTELADEIESLPVLHGDFLPIAADVTDEDFMLAAVQQTVERFGRLDILVANAGIGHRGSIVDSDWSDIEMLLRTNIDGMLHSIRACVPAMRLSGSGHIITVSSVAAHLITPYAANYAASKAFVSSLAKSLRMELADDNIRVSDFLIGRTQTAFNEVRLGAGSRSESRIPTMPAEQVAEAIVKATSQNKETVFVRLFDRLTVWGSKIVPDFIGRQAMKQYR